MTVWEAIKRINEFALHHAIQELPNSERTVEAFEMAIDALGIVSKIVTCGDCEYKRVQKNGQKFCGLHGSHYGMIVTDDWFCADGDGKDVCYDERKSN